MVAQPSSGARGLSRISIYNWADIGCWMGLLLYVYIVGGGMCASSSDPSVQE